MTPEHGGAEQVRGDAEVEHAGDRRRRVVGVQGGQHEVAGQRRLDRHFGGFQVADFADHDDVRVLAHQRPDALRETEVDDVLHLQLVERRLDHLDRVFDGAHIDRRRGQLLERRVERRRFSRTGRAGDEDDSVGPVGHRFPARLIVVGEAEFGETRTSTSGSKMRITSFSPKAVGSVDRRSSASWPSAVRVLMRPSCGRRFSTTSMRPRILTRLIIAAMTLIGIWYT
jgi:hypothetical protein